MAPDLLSDAFDAAAYAVYESDSAWRLEGGDEALIAELAAGLRRRRARNRQSCRRRSRSG